MSFWFEVQKMKISVWRSDDDWAFGSSSQTICRIPVVKMTHDEALTYAKLLQKQKPLKGSDVVVLLQLAGTSHQGITLAPGTMLIRICSSTKLPKCLPFSFEVIASTKRPDGLRIRNKLRRQCKDYACRATGWFLIPDKLLDSLLKQLTEHPHIESPDRRRKLRHLSGMSQAELNSILKSLGED